VSWIDEQAKGEIEKMDILATALLQPNPTVTTAKKT
jgi:hypothetical protein